MNHKQLNSRIAKSIALNTKVDYLVSKKNKAIKSSDNVINTRNIRQFANFSYDNEHFVMPTHLIEDIKVSSRCFTGFYLVAILVENFVRYLHTSIIQMNRCNLIFNVMEKR